MWRMVGLCLCRVCIASHQLFSDSLLLPPYVGASRATTMSKKELAQLASVVHRRFQLLKKDLVPWLDIIPDPWAQRLLYLKQCVEQELHQVRMVLLLLMTSCCFSH